MRFSTLSRKKLILFLASFAVSFVVLFGTSLLLSRDSYQTYIFATVAPKPFDFKQVQQPELNSFYLVSAADIFAQTIQGWVKDPTFLEHVHEKLGGAVVSTDKLALIGRRIDWIKVKKDSPQNIIIFFPSQALEASVSNADGAGASSLIEAKILETLGERIAEYNHSSLTQFSLVNVNATTINTAPNPSVLAALSFAAALCIAFVLVVITLAARAQER